MFLPRLLLISDEPLSGQPLLIKRLLAIFPRMAAEYVNANTVTEQKYLIVETLTSVNLCLNTQFRMSLELT